MNAPFRLRFHLALAAVALSATACTPNLEQSPAFQEQIARLDKVEEGGKEIRLQISSMEHDFQSVSKDMAQLAARKGGPAPAPDALKALDQRLAAMEKRLSELSAKSFSAPRLKQATHGAPTAAANEDDESGNAPEAQTAPSTVRKATSKNSGNARLTVTTKSKLGKKGEKLENFGKSRLNETSAPSSEDSMFDASGAPIDEAPAKHKHNSGDSGGAGAYHKVRSGETLAQIAAHYHVTGRKIRSANHLPTGAALVPGQTIYIPQGE